MRGNAIKVNKFNFTYHDLAYRVRENMFHALQPYDKNFNGLFQEPQIVEALVNILNEDQNQIRYVVSNVFRYDRDGDKAVTYDQFVNFSVEQHFGQLAIQRLHRKGVYSRGKERLMNLDEFEVTLNESLKYIASQGNRGEYQHLFNQIDIDHDGWIKYEDFFVFLREYFGSLSLVANSPQQQLPDPPAAIESHPLIDFAQQRFARLVYNQLKISVMQNDLSRSLSLSRQEVGNILLNVFHVHPEEKEQLTNLIVGQQSVISYEKFMKVMVPFYFCQYDVHRSNINHVNQDDFVNIVRNACQFVSVKPSGVVLREIFRKADSAQKEFLQRNEYINTLGMILENYQFDYRGSGRAF